ncbi:unnamed protein product [Bathycoccus prasinos]
MVDYSKWDALKYSSSEEDDDDDDDDEKGEKEALGSAKMYAALANLSLSSSSSSSKIWTGLVMHHRDVFVSHVIPKLNETDRWFFSKVNRESQDVLAYAGVNVSGLHVIVYECSSISTLEWAWNHFPWGEKDDLGNVMDQAWFCVQVAQTKKLEFLEWAREVKQCEWDEQTINKAACKGNLEMLKYCFSNGCPCDVEESCVQAAIEGHLDCVRFLFDKVKPSRDTEKEAAQQAACGGHVEILKYFVDTRKISDEVKSDCVGNTTMYGQLDCLKYLVEEAKVPLDNWRYIASARTTTAKTTCSKKGCPEPPTDEDYASFLEQFQKFLEQFQKRQ